MILFIKPGHFSAHTVFIYLACPFLAGIVSYPELIRVSLPDDSPLLKPLETIENAGKRAAAVVDDMLTIARNVASVKESVNLNDLIADFLTSPEWLRIRKIYPEVRVSQRLDPELVLIQRIWLVDQGIVLNYVQFLKLKLPVSGMGVQRSMTFLL